MTVPLFPALRRVGPGHSLGLRGLPGQGVGGGLAEALPAEYLASSLTLPWSLLRTSTRSMKGAFSLHGEFTVSDSKHDQYLLLCG